MADLDSQRVPQDLSRSGTVADWWTAEEGPPAPTRRVLEGHLLGTPEGGCARAGSASMVERVPDHGIVQLAGDHT